MHHLLQECRDRRRQKQTTGPVRSSSADVVFAQQGEGKHKLHSAIVVDGKGAQEVCAISRDTIIYNEADWLGTMAVW